MGSPNGQIGLVSKDIGIEISAYQSHEFGFGMMLT
jgi:hypothetical protein